MIAIIQQGFFEKYPDLVKKIQSVVGGSNHVVISAKNDLQIHDFDSFIDKGIDLTDANVSLVDIRQFNKGCYDFCEDLNMNVSEYASQNVDVYDQRDEGVSPDHCYVCENWNGVDELIRVALIPPSTEPSPYKDWTLEDF